MTEWLKRARRKRRALNYLSWNPEDGPIIRTMLDREDVLAAQSAREAAEKTIRMQIPEDVWQEYAPQWERVFNYVSR